MNSPKLLKLFRINEDEWERMHTLLYESPLSNRLGIPIHQYKSLQNFDTFYYYTEEIMLLSSNIFARMMLLTKIMDRIPKIAIEHFMRSCLIEEIQSSNDIEGVRSTRREIKIALDEQNNKSSAANVRLWGIVNKYLKLQNQESIKFNNSADLRNFYNDFALDEVCREDKNNAPDGKIFRAQNVDVWSSTKVIHRGVFPESKIISYMDKALELLNNEKIPSLIRISIFHYLFGYIHPFYDGNGRTSRFITSYYLSKVLNTLVAMRLSLTIKDSTRVYYKLFENTNSVGNAGDLTPFITGFLWLIEKSIERVYSELEVRMTTLNRLMSVPPISEIKNSTDKKIYYVLLQAMLFSSEGATLEEISNTVSSGKRTVRRRLEGYPKEHIVVNKQHRAYRYYLNNNIWESTKDN